MEKMCEQKKSLHEFYELKIKDIMQAPKSKLACVDEKANVATVFSLILHTDHVWVIDSTEPTQLLGVITESDMIVLLTPPVTSSETFEKPDSRSLQFGEMPNIEEIMSKKPVTISPDFTIKDALILMKEQRIKHLPVVDESQCFIGEISLHQLLKEYSKKDATILKDS